MLLFFVLRLHPDQEKGELKNAATKSTIGAANGRQEMGGPFDTGITSAGDLGAKSDMMLIVVVGAHEIGSDRDRLPGWLADDLFNHRLDAHRFRLRA